MRSVLGIDAAWTEREPSGVALIADDGSGWRLMNASASYDAFTNSRALDGLPVRHTGSRPDAPALMSASSGMIGHPVDLIAIDMPLSLTPIVSRRASDNIVSSMYGAKRCATHTPSAARPGKLSDELRASFQNIGYPLAVSKLCGHDLIEVYPHPALVELASAERRLPYKHSKVGRYWPQDAPPTRRKRLLEVWSSIVILLECHIAGTSELLRLPPLDARGHEMKAFEDTLDAVVCAWVGACALDGIARPFGNEESAIWIPSAPSFADASRDSLMPP